jgi:hypothetical protein
MSRTVRIYAVSCLALLVTALPAPDQVDDESLQCLTALNAFDSSSSAWSAVPVTQIVTSEAYEPQLDRNLSYTTLCDGRPRAVETRYTTEYTTYDPPWTRTLDQGQVPGNTYTEPSPTCSIAEAACTSFLASYDSALSDYITNDAPSPTLKPQCTAYQTCKRGDTEECRIYGYGGNIYY